MPEETPTDTTDFARELIDFEGNEERAHTSGERAADQVIKILGAVQAGLALTLAGEVEHQPPDGAVSSGKNC
jgi:hypothetical protein